MNRRRALFTAVITLAVAWGTLALLLTTGTGPELGLDLRGGFEVVLQAPIGTDASVVDKAVEIMRRRVESLGGVQEPEIAPSGDSGIKVQLPGVTDRERALSAVGTTGQLSFRPVLEIGQIPGVSPLLAGGTAPDAFPEGVDPVTGLTVEDDPTGEAWLVEESTGIVYHVDGAAVLGSDISGAEAMFSGGGHLGAGGVGSWVVDPDFTAQGARKFEDATRALAEFPVGHPQRRFAIVLDGVIASAPTVAADVTPEEGLSASSAIITVGSSDDPETEAEDLATVLRYGALPVAFEQSRVVSVSATLGADSLSAGLLAGIGGLILVAIAMVLYYRILGAITVVGLSVFGSFLVLAFTLLSESRGDTLTLAGVAGVIVSVGITSDSYIVFFERIKEEVRHGRPLRAAVDHAFPRAFRTILTGDTVSFSAALLLWVLAIGPVKGFAVALGLATLIDVLVAYVFTRPAAAYLVRTRLGDGGAMSIRGAVGHPAEAVT